MRLDKTVDLIHIEKVPDGRGGHKKLEQFIKTVDCNVKQTRFDKQEKLYGEVSISSISIITFEEIDKDYIIRYLDKKYKIFNGVEAFRKFAYDLEEIKND